MTKTPEESFAEMKERDRISNVHSGAYTFWRDSNYSKINLYDKFKKFDRWFNPEWTLPPHVQAISDLYSSYFTSHKIIPTDSGEGVQIHLNPSNEPNDPKNWRLWCSWSYTICVPFSNDYDNTDWDPIEMIYHPWVDLRTTEINPIKISRNKYNTVKIKPYERISFPSSGIAHKVLPSNNKCYWIFSDLRYDPDSMPHKDVNIKKISTLNDLREDMIRTIGLKNHEGQFYLKEQFMSDLEYFHSFNREPSEMSWIPKHL
jgi:hypothetical protein